jgi:hypothetical protein
MRRNREVRCTVSKTLDHTTTCSRRAENVHTSLSASGQWWWMIDTICPNCSELNWFTNWVNLTCNTTHGTRRHNTKVDEDICQPPTAVVGGTDRFKHTLSARVTSFISAAFLLITITFRYDRAMCWALRHRSRACQCVVVYRFGAVVFLILENFFSKSLLSASAVT